MANYFVRCRCGDRHPVTADTLGCRFCGTPTFDVHGVCAGCRGAEAIAEKQRLLRKSLVRR